MFGLLRLFSQRSVKSQTTRKAPRTRLACQQLEDRCNPSTSFLATDLVSDLPGVARVTDPSLVNAFGISLSPTSGAFWVSSNGNGLSELYSGDVNGSDRIIGSERLRTRLPVSYCLKRRLNVLIPHCISPFEASSDTPCRVTT